MVECELSSFILRLLGGIGGIGSLEREAVNGDGGGEAGNVHGAFFGGGVLGQTPLFLVAELLKLRLVHRTPLLLEFCFVVFSAGAGKPRTQTQRETERTAVYFLGW